MTKDDCHSYPSSLFRKLQFFFVIEFKWKLSVDNYRCWHTHTIIIIIITITWCIQMHKKIKNIHRNSSNQNWALIVLFNLSIAVFWRGTYGSEFDGILFQLRIVLRRLEVRSFWVWIMKENFIHSYNLNVFHIFHYLFLVDLLHFLKVCFFLFRHNSCI